MLNSRNSLNVQALSSIFMFRLKTQAQCSCFMCWKKIAQAKCLSSMFRLNTQAQYQSFFCAKKLLRLNVQDQYLGLMCLIYLAYFR